MHAEDYGYIFYKTETKFTYDAMTIDLWIIWTMLLMSLFLVVISFFVDHLEQRISELEAYSPEREPLLADFC